MLEKDNQLLLKKLVEISLGKRSTIPVNPLRNSSSNQRISLYGLKKELSLENVLEDARVEQKVLKTARYVTTTKSLNNHIKIQELRRIERENKKIADKIISIQPTMRSEDLEIDFMAHKSISEGLRRIKKRRIPMFEGLTLPPISGALTHDEPIIEAPEKPTKSRYQSTNRRQKIELKSQ